MTYVTELVPMGDDDIVVITLPGAGTPPTEGAPQSCFTRITEFAAGTSEVLLLERASPSWIRNIKVRLSKAFSGDPSTALAIKVAGQEGWVIPPECLHPQSLFEIDFDEALYLEAGERLQLSISTYSAVGAGKIFIDYNGG